ncbi:MAG TPA: PIG-L family deacetylase [Thermoanaerobaculaceae bacterium]|nr:PIG-L family deacetylase [Thermoanaerobaculaceae bacterium]HRS15840.1 PIG-L family deacetylase [Thermoanaerobaculaceae bacterium]
MPGRLPEEGELIPFAGGFPPGRQWLVLAPHPDDETLGLGGTLALAAGRGVEIAIVCLTSGDAQGVAGVREDEARRAAGELGVAPPLFWRLPDRGLGAMRSGLAARLGRLFDESGAETVVTPSLVELHPDHRAVALAVQVALRRRFAWGLRRRAPAWVVAYEVGAPLLPNLLVEVDATWDRKRRALACYASQLGFRPYAAVTEGLGALRTLTLPSAQRAEGFFVLPARRVARLGARRWASQMGAVRVL